jgi:hypothetical protein
VNLGQFFGLQAVASNIVGGNTTVYTADMFNADFPQFCQKTTTTDPDTGDTTVTYESFIPPSMLDMFISMANAAISENRWFEQWRYAMGLFVAHYAALYLTTYRDGSPTQQAAAMVGALRGIVKSSSMGDTAVSYDTSAITAATEQWGAWNATVYGQQLVTMAQLVSMGGSYII